MGLKIAILLSPSKTQYFINQAYVEFIKVAGYTPVLVSPEHNAEEVAEMCDGLLLPGGIDVDPIYYGEDNWNSMSTDPVKDEFERVMFHAFRDAAKPIFGICRGFQLIAREYMHAVEEAAGFLEFVQHVSFHQQTTDQSLVRNIPQHWVYYSQRAVYGIKSHSVVSMPVNSMHHQCLVADIGNTAAENPVLTVGSFHMAAWTNRGLKHDKNFPDRVICEAFRIVGWGAPILAVQWHPEELMDTALIQNFFDRATSVKKKTTAIEGAV